jgi:uncharacterized protein YndB with AHSA1/START domain
MSDNNELILTRTLDATPEKLFRCWTEPELLKQWFCPQPWFVSEAQVDLRPGGRSYTVMNGPNGEVMPNEGIYLEVVPNEKIVFTDAYTAGWQPSAKPFFTGIITFEDLGGGKTKYTARARHWKAEDKAMHEQMGFEVGWGICATQLEALAKTL